MTDPLDLDAIEKRCNAASEGPWIVDENTGHLILVGDDLRRFCEVFLQFREKDGFIRQDANRVFIAHARTDIPALVAEVRRLREYACELEVELKLRDDEIEKLRGLKKKC